MTNTTGNGIYQGHGSFLTDSWPNDILWQLDFDVSANNWVYVGFMPICSADVNPFTDAKRATCYLDIWEGFSYPNSNGLAGSYVSQDPYSKDTSVNKWHHMTIIKLTNTQLKIILDDTYVAIYDAPNLPNISELHIGVRDNPAARNTGGIVSLKNIKVKAL